MMPRMKATPPESTSEVRAAHRFDEARLARFLRDANLDVDTDGEIVVRQFRGGQSNPTFWIGVGERAFVLRKKPPGVLLPSAHAVEREHRVIEALAATDVPVARARALCLDESIVGTPFYLMDYVQGRIFWDVRLPDVAPAERAAIYDAHVRVLAAIHRVDVDAVGLSDFGKRGGYVARQVARWTKQYEASRTGSEPAMEALMTHLAQHVPEGDETTLTHGDYRLDNLIFHPDEPRVLAVIDWELSTLGHPLSDLAYVCMLHHVELPGMGGLLGNDPAVTGIPSEAAYVDRYCELTGRAGVADLEYHEAFSLFRLAAIAQGVYKRSLQGNASSENASRFGDAVGRLAEVACARLGIRAGSASRSPNTTGKGGA
jgi:aminoglycoside phosphotransferase (APT) family kinase protein